MDNQVPQEAELRKRINKDLILRERLALERTEMANDRTLLAFIRTSLYFAVAGMTINSLLKAGLGIGAEIVLWAFAGLLLVTGFLKYFAQKRKLKKNEMHVGDYKLEWEDDVE